MSSSVSPLLDQWEHVAVVYDGTSLTFYLNGGGANGGVAFQAVGAALAYIGYQGSILIGDMCPTWTSRLRLDLRSAQGVPQEAEKIAVHDGCLIGGVEPGSAQQCAKALEIRNGFQILRRLLEPEPAIQVRPDAHTMGVASQLAEVVNVGDDLFQPQIRILWCRLIANPVRNHHPGVQCHAHDRAACDQRSDLFVVQLTVVRNQRATVGMTSPYRPLEYRQCLPKRLVAKMGHIQDHPQPVHLA